MQLSAEEASFRSIKPGFPIESPRSSQKDVAEFTKEIPTSYWYFTAGTMFIVFPQVGVGYHFQHHGFLGNTISFSTPSVIEITQLFYFGDVKKNSNNGYIGIGLNSILDINSRTWMPSMIPGMDLIGGYRFRKRSSYNFFKAQIGALRRSDIPKGQL